MLGAWYASCITEQKRYLRVKCPLCLRVSLIKLSNFCSFAMLSMVHSPPTSLKMSSISCLNIGTYWGQLARLKIVFVSNWLVVFTLKAERMSCKIACKCGSFLSFGSCASSRIHSIESSGFLWSWPFSRATLSARMGARSSCARRLQWWTSRSSGMKNWTTGRRIGWNTRSFADDKKIFLVYYNGCIRSCLTTRFRPELSLTLALMSIHSSFSWSPFPTRILVLIRLTSLNTFGYTFTGVQSTKGWDYTNIHYSGICTFAFREFDRNQTVGTFLGIQEHRC